MSWPASASSGPGPGRSRSSAPPARSSRWPMTRGCRRRSRQTGWQSAACRRSAGCAASCLAGDPPERSRPADRCPTRPFGPVSGGVTRPDQVRLSCTEPRCAHAPGGGGAGGSVNRARSLPASSRTDKADRGDRGPQPGPRTFEGVEPMGRGRAKAKQAKVARQLKYSGGGTDLDRLRTELGVGTGRQHGGRDRSDAEHPEYADYVDRYAVDADEDADDSEDEDDYLAGDADGYRMPQRR